MSKLSRRMKRLLAIVLVEAVVAVNVLTSFAHEADEPYTMTAEQADEEAGDGAETSQDSGGSDYDDSDSSDAVMEVETASSVDETQTELDDADSEKEGLEEEGQDEVDLVPALAPTDTTGEAGEAPESDEVIEEEVSAEDAEVTEEDEVLDAEEASEDVPDADAQDDDNEAEASDEAVTDEEDSVEVADADTATDESEETEDEDDTAVTVAGEDGIEIASEDEVTDTNGVYEIDNTLYQELAASGMDLFKVLSMEQLQELKANEEKVEEQVAAIANDIESNMKNSSGQSLTDQQKQALQDFLKSISKASNFAAYTDTLYAGQHMDGNFAANDVKGFDWVPGENGEWVEDGTEYVKVRDGYWDAEANQWIPEEGYYQPKYRWEGEWVQQEVEGSVHFGKNTNMGDGFSYVGNSGNVHPDKGAVNQDGEQIVGSIVVGGSASVDNWDGANPAGIDVIELDKIPTDPAELEKFLEEHPELSGLENVTDIKGNLADMSQKGQDLINSMTSGETFDKESSEELLKELAKEENMAKLGSDDILVANVSIDALTNPSDSMDENHGNVLENLIKNNINGATIVINVVIGEDVKDVNDLYIMLGMHAGDYFPEWGDLAQYVVWNFGNYSGTINLEKSFGGVIVAPNATVAINSTIGAGRVIADTIDQSGGELHGAGYYTPGPMPTPGEPEPTESPEPEKTPEPSATPEPTEEPTPVPTATPKPTEEPTPVPTATPYPTEEPTPVPTATPEPTEEPTPVPSATPEPTESPVPDETPEPTESPAPDVTPEPTPGETPVPTATPGTPGEPEPTPGTPGDEPEPTPYVVEEVPTPAPTQPPQVLGARRITAGGTDAAVLGARRGSDYAVLGKRRRPSTGDSIAMVMWILTMMAAAGGAIVSLVMMHYNKKKGE